MVDSGEITRQDKISSPNTLLHYPSFDSFYCVTHSSVKWGGFSSAMSIDCICRSMMHVLFKTKKNIGWNWQPVFSVRELTIEQVCSIPCHLVSSKELGHFVAVTLLWLYHDLHLQLVNNGTVSSLTSGSFSSKQIRDALRVINRDCQRWR